MEEYKDMFLSEAREHLDDLNNLLVALEKTRDDKDTINNIFRNFHTLKGNSATMGYDAFSKLAHRLEDLLDLVRNGKLTVNSEIMDVLFKGCDLLELGLKKIEGNVAESLNIADVLSKIEPLIHVPCELDLDKSKNIEEKDAPETISLTHDEELILSSKPKDKVCLLSILFDNAPLKSAKAMAIIKKIEQDKNSAIIKITPKREELAEKMKSSIAMVIYSEDKAGIEAMVKEVSKIKEYKITPFFGKIEEPKSQSVSPSINSEKSKTEKMDAIEKKDTIVKCHTEELKKVQEVKIDIKRLDSLMDMVGELLIHKMRLEEINKGIASKDLKEITKAISILTQNIQSEVIEERMIPIGTAFSRLPRIVRDLSHEEGKDIEFIMEGDDKKLDRTVVDKITDPLVHMIRNSVDHGIETPIERESNGKQKKGIIKLCATREKNSVVIEITDDGQGIDSDKIKAVALKKKAFSKEELDQMSVQKIQELVFIPGFSTNETITEISGRGVGMDVVMTNIKQVGGKVFLESKKGKGTKIKIELPMTLAIIKVLLINVGDEKYAIPLNNVHEIIELKQEELKTIQTNDAFILRGETIPLLKLRNLLGIKDEKPKRLTTIIVEDGDKKIGILVDSIESQQQILIKNVDERIKKSKGISGGTILGDGKVCFILDIANLIQK